MSKKLQSGHVAIYIGNRKPLLIMNVDEVPDESIIFKGDFGNLIFQQHNQHIKKVLPNKIRILYKKSVCDNLEVVDDGGNTVEFREIK